MALLMKLVLVMTLRPPALVRHSLWGWPVDGVNEYRCTNHIACLNLVARDSFKDEVIVRTFLITVLCLVVFAVIMPLYNKWKRVIVQLHSFPPIV